MRYLLALAFLLIPFGAHAQPERRPPTPAEEAFARGYTAIMEGDTLAAITAFEEAYHLDSLLAGAAYNLGLLAARRGDHEAAIPWYARALRALTITDPGPPIVGEDPWASDYLDTVLGLLYAGAELFQQGRLDEARPASEAVLAAVPHHRDALYNLALTLYRQEEWNALVAVAERLVAVDPLNYNARVVLFNAHRGQFEASGEAEDRLRALAVLDSADALPIRIEDVRLRTLNDTTTVAGSYVRGRAEPGTPIRLTFTLLDPHGLHPEGSVILTAPADDETATFTLPVWTRRVPLSYRYRVVE